MRKERLARGWSLQELARATGINVGHLSRIENGKRPPTENLAAACDAAFPERRGWFSEYYEEMRTWSEVPAAFKDWSELEDKAATRLRGRRLSSTGCYRPRTTPPRCCTPIPVLVKRRCRPGWPRGWSGSGGCSPGTCWRGSLSMS